MITEMPVVEKIFEMPVVKGRSEMPAHTGTGVARHLYQTIRVSGRDACFKASWIER